MTMAPSVEVNCRGETMQLRGDGSLFLPEFEALLVADLHLGKDASFRAAGHPVPSGADTTILAMLKSAIQATAATRLIVLGDLIHDFNSMTAELETGVSEWRSQMFELEFVLIRGNHDRHVRSFPATWRVDDRRAMDLGPFTLVHETPVDEKEVGREVFQIGGHWHPVLSVGRGADQMRLRCFVLNNCSLTLPAFGPFKGGLKQSQNRGTRYFPICDGFVWENVRPGVAYKS